MEENNITPDTLPTNVDGEGAVKNIEDSTEDSQEESVNNLDLNELNQLLGKNYPTKEAALKSIKDTFSHVGKKQEAVKGEMKEKGFMTKEEAEDLFFLRDHPEHSGNKDILEAIAKNNNITLEKAAQTESYKKLFEGSAKYEEYQSNQSVMESSPRLAEQTERMDKVRELQHSGNVEEARTEAARAVMDAYMPTDK